MADFKIVLAGCGNMARRWVEYALSREDAAIVGLVDVVPENAQRMAESYSLSCPVFTELPEAIERSGANLVFDVTIPESHTTVVRTALGAGCSVFGEKPMAASLGDARTMLAEAERSGRTYAVMQNRRYNKRIRSLREIVSGGSIGTVGMLNADFFLGPHFGGFRDLMEHPLILDMAIHTFDEARFISGSDAVSVYCHEFNPPGSWYKGAAASVCIFELADGSVFCYRGSWCAEGAPTSWESSWRIIGSKGTAMWDGENAPYLETVQDPAETSFFRTTKRSDPPLTWAGQEAHAGCLDEMFTSLLESRKAETDCSDNIKTMEMVFGAIESAESGKKVALGR